MKCVFGPTKYIKMFQMGEFTSDKLSWKITVINRKDKNILSKSYCNIAGIYTTLDTVNRSVDVLDS